MPRLFPCRAGRAALVMSALILSAGPATAELTGLAQLAAASASAVDNSPEAALAQNLRVLAREPRNFQALIAAGRAALETGDAQAAVGFFGRAQDVSPQAWQPQAGMAATMVAMGDPQGAMTYFARAQQYGAAHILIAVDRGLAFDLLGDQAKAQSDYRAALVGADADEARRRLALSLAISRDIKGAAAVIEPLLVRRDPQALRVNAFVLALAGDREGARRTIDSAMPGAGMRFEPFFKVLPVLRAEEKAAAVHLGIFPADASQRYAQAEPVPSSPVVSLGNSSPPRQATVAKNKPRRPEKRAEAPRRAVREAAQPSTYLSMVRPSLDPSRYASTRRAKSNGPAAKKDEPASSDPEPRPVGRLDDIARLLDETPPVELAETPLAISDPPAPVQVSKPKLESEPRKAKVSRPKVETANKATEDKKKAEKLAAEKKAKQEAAKLGVAGTNWVQLAGGANQDRLGAEYKKIAAKAGSLLRSKSGYVTEGKDYFRLLIGPFDSADEAQAMVSKLDKAGVDSFRWTRKPAQIRIEKLTNS